MTIEARGIRAGYGAAEVLRGVSVCVRAGELVGIIGPNGCGKSTLMRVMSRLMRPAAGDVAIDGKPVRGLGRRELSRRLAVLPQEPSTPPQTTVRELVAMGRTPHRRFGAVLPGGMTSEDRAAIDGAMRATEVDRLADRPASELSGGERRRAWIAMCLAQESPTVLLDEPVTALDVRHQLEVMSLLRTIAVDRGLAVGLVVHDLDLAARYCTRLVAMESGEVVADGPPADVLCEQTLGRVFGVVGSARVDGGSGELGCRVRLADA